VRGEAAVSDFLLEKRRALSVNEILTGTNEQQPRPNFLCPNRSIVLVPTSLQQETLAPHLCAHYLLRSQVTIYRGCCYHRGGEEAAEGSKEDMGF